VRSVAWDDPATVRLSEAHRLPKSAAYVSAPRPEVKPGSLQISRFSGLWRIVRRIFARAFRALRGEARDCSKLRIDRMGNTRRLMGNTRRLLAKRPLALPADHQAGGTPRSRRHARSGTRPATAFQFGLTHSWIKKKAARRRLLLLCCVRVIPRPATARPRVWGPSPSRALRE
jgi:hypothetical protein